MGPTLFGLPLDRGQFYLCDDSGHKLPLQMNSLELHESVMEIPIVKFEAVVGPNLRAWHPHPVKKTDGIKKVIFHDPATIIIWKDGSKTIVKCQEGDTYSKELGLAMCFAKKFLGNKGNFNEIFKKHLKEE